MNRVGIDQGGTGSHDLFWQLRDRLEAELLRGCRNVVFVPDGPVARKLAAEALDGSYQARPAFVPAALIRRLMPHESVSVEALCGDADVVVVCVDDQKVEVLSWLNSLKWGSLPSIVVGGVGHQVSNREVLSQMEFACPIPSHATGYDLVKVHIYDSLRYLRHRYARGVIAEMGTFRGGTLLLISEMLRALNFVGPELVGFDTFAGFPPRRSLLDIFSMTRYEDHNYDGIRGRLMHHGIQVVRGDIVDTAEWLATKDLLLTFFDTDNYSPAAAALPICFERTVPGGVIVFDHYYTRPEYWDTLGERVAAEEFFRDRTDFLHLSGTGVFVKAFAERE